MALFMLENDRFLLVVSTNGGTILKYVLKYQGDEVPLLRPTRVSEETASGESGCFPLIPFGNRVKENRFYVDQREYKLEPNTSGDPHYLHGDGWLGEWHRLSQQHGSLTLGFQREQEAYHYRAEQCFELNEQGLTLTLTVWHLGENPMPYGLGWHPFFPLTAETRIQAKADSYWLEDAGWLAGKRAPLIPSLDFNQPAILPRQWINNGFHGWDGHARLQWPERKLQLQLLTQPPCPVFFLFMPDSAFDRHYQGDFFCLEPMSHAANAHNIEGKGGLRMLAQGEQFSQQCRLNCIDMA
ncbi:hypothetical protein ED28_18955 [[Pantoea] beijingensis]|uniref:Aldose 1-epimerase n=1 Tax=[Pantoea] beijingensis TaxID=1324864 RepID=A0A443I8Y0_9GAMM|nr:MULTISPECIES: aldose 1-epimerase [Erwiniaceae]RWR00568.1 hypothetical protein ED28_18955 [[Pantoea] beijingensis]